MACAEDVFTKLERCTNDQEKQNVNVTRKVIDAGIDFICHNDGDRIACKYEGWFWDLPTQCSIVLDEIVSLKGLHVYHYR